nr:HNH endonuclease [uncultured Allomuricauda sp.]
MRNPKWKRDELILALNLYFKLINESVDSNHPKVIELSKVLNQLSIHEKSAFGESFRNANGVSMKLSNYKRFDLHYSGKGLEKGGKLEKVIWDEFNQDREKLNNLSQAIFEMATDQKIKSELNPIEADFEVNEGELFTKLHIYRERNRSIVNKKKKLVLNEKGELTCEVCSFNFEKIYGKLGKGFIECHHTKPISELRPNEKTKLKDLALVCSNCHRIIHKNGNIPIDKLRVLIKGNSYFT